MNNNNAPFYVGQRVVCVSGIGSLVKNERYTVSSCLFCNKCKIWYTTVFELSPRGGFECKCGCLLEERPKNRGALSSRFAPIDERTVSIPESLKEQAEEMIRVRELIEEPVKERV